MQYNKGMSFLKTRKIFSKIFFSEMAFVIVVILAVLLFNIIPYLYAWGATPPDKQFLGAVFNQVDVSNYLTKMAQGADGGWLTHNQYTHELNKPVLAHTLYVVLGKMAHLLGLSNILMLVIARVFFGAVLLVAIYLLLKKLFDSPQIIKVSYLFICFASGLGWLVRSSFTPIDLYLPDAIAIERFTDMPHFLLGHIILVVSVIFLINFLRDRKIWSLVVSGLSGLILGFVIPFHLPVLYLTVLISFLLVSLKERVGFSNIKYLILFFIISSPSLIYLAIIYSTNGVFHFLATQNFVMSPSIASYTIGFGVVGILGLIGAVAVYKKTNKRLFVVLSWLVAVAMLVYAPVIFQRRFFQTAVYIPLGICAAVGVTVLFDRNGKWFRRVVKLVLVLALISNLYAFQFIITTVSYDSSQLNFYIGNTTVTALKWIKEKTDLNSVLLSSYYTGNMVPVFANRTVYLGHNVETVDYHRKLISTQNFYLQQFTPDKAELFLREAGITHVLFFEVEQDLGYKDPSSYSFLRKIYNEDALIFQVI